MFYWAFASPFQFWPPTIFNSGYAYATDAGKVTATAGGVSWRKSLQPSTGFVSMYCISVSAAETVHQLRDRALTSSTR